MKTNWLCCGKLFIFSSLLRKGETQEWGKLNMYIHYYSHTVLDVREEWWFVWCVTLILKYYRQKRQNWFHRWKLHFGQLFWNAFFLIQCAYMRGDFTTVWGMIINHCSTTVRHVLMLIRSNCTRTKISHELCHLWDLKSLTVAWTSGKTQVQIHLLQIQIFWQRWKTIKLLHCVFIFPYIKLKTHFWKKISDMSQILMRYFMSSTSIIVTYACFINCTQSNLNIRLRIY